MTDDFKDWLLMNGGEGLPYYERFRGCELGIAESNNRTVIAYDYEQVVACIQQDTGCTYEEAVDDLYYNYIGAIFEDAPTFLSFYEPLQAHSVNGEEECTDEPL